MRSELFKTALQSYKDEWAKCLQEGGEGKRVAAFLEKIDHQIPLSQHMFDVAWQHRQTEVDELQKRVDQALRILDENSFVVTYKDYFHEVVIREDLEQALKGGSNEEQ